MFLLGRCLIKAVDFYRLCFEAFAKTPYTVVLSVGRHIAIADLGALSPNFNVRNHVPQLAVLKQSRLFVTHGGMNSVNEGLFFGVPLMVFPQGADQHRNVLTYPITSLRRDLQKKFFAVKGRAEDVTYNGLCRYNASGQFNG